MEDVLFRLKTIYIFLIIKLFLIRLYVEAGQVRTLGENQLFSKIYQTLHSECGIVFNAPLL